MGRYAKAFSLTGCLVHRSSRSVLRLSVGRHGAAASRLSSRAQETAASRLRGGQGETLAETLVSLLIIVTALTILAGGIATGARVNRQADTKYAVVFPPPMSGDGAHFTKDEYSVPFSLSLSDGGSDETLRERLALSPAAGEDAGQGAEMKAMRVKVRKALALDRNGSETTWRILYVFEDAVEDETEDAAEDGTEPEENPIGE